MTLEANLHINGSRLWASLMELAEIGKTPKGGVCRLALTDLDRQGRDTVIAWGKAEGLSVSIDQMGNVFMRRPGRNNALAPVVAGSHIDTQPTGGKFDGNYGVLSALEVVRTLNDHQIETEAPVEVVFWTNEEGSRFVPVMMGSGVFAGAFSLEHAYAARDVDGKSVKEELERIGYVGEEVCGQHPMSAYFEAHIEQGPILEDTNTTIGVVSGGLGQRWYDCVVTGVEAHAGPTPMKLRKDALQVATHIMQEVVRIANDSQPHGRGTVGFVQVFPNSRNVIPGRVSFSIDFRNIDDAHLEEMDARLKAFLDEQRRLSGLDIELKQVSYYAPTFFAPECIESVRDAAKARGYSHMDIVSGAGHDAIYMARLCPSGMIFVPCKDGISHNEIEYASPEDLEAGANVLLDAVLRHAKVAR